METHPLIPAAVIAALVSGIISFLSAVIQRSSAIEVRERQTAAEWSVLAAKIDADYQLALRRVEADIASTMSERAWADYELRRDAYVQLARLIACLFEGGSASDRPDFHKAARQVRLVGSDDVVSALNAMTAEIRHGGQNADALYRGLFNAMRRDIRRIHTLPPEGTDLGEEAFPIES